MGIGEEKELGVASEATRGSCVGDAPVHYRRRFPIRSHLSSYTTHSMTDIRPEPKTLPTPPRPNNEDVSPLGAF